MAPADLHRRKILAAVSSASALALAGCSILDEQEQPPPKLRINNLSNQSVTVSLSVKNAESGELVIDEEVSVEPEGKHPYEQPFTTDGEKSLTASLKGGGTKEYSWRTAAEQGSSVVSVVIGKDGDLSISHSTA